MFKMVLYVIAPICVIASVYSTCLISNQHISILIKPPSLQKLVNLERSQLGRILEPVCLFHQLLELGNVALAWNLKLCWFWVNRLFGVLFGFLGDVWLL